MLDDLISSLKDDFKLTDEGDSEKFLGEYFKKNGHDALEFTQLHLMQCFLKAFSLNDDSKLLNAPANAVLHKCQNSKKEYRTGITAALHE